MEERTGWAVNSQEGVSDFFAMSAAVAEVPEAPGRVRAICAIGLLSVAELFVMSLWLAPVSVSGAILHDWHFEASTAAWLMMTVQLGFVAGSLGLAISNLADLLSAPVLFAMSALFAAAANLAPVISPGSSAALFGSRLLVGCFLAGVYPIGMKIAASWFRVGRGQAL
jgi:MFS family permease